MEHLKPLNRRAMKLNGVSDSPDVYGYACSVCCPAWAPGWEVDASGRVDPCPWMSDLALCWVTCYWTGTMPDNVTQPTWLDDCSLISEDWVHICVVPD